MRLRAQMVVDCPPSRAEMGVMASGFHLYRVIKGPDMRWGGLSASNRLTLELRGGEKGGS